MTVKYCLEYYEHMDKEWHLISKKNTALNKITGNKVVRGYHPINQVWQESSIINSAVLTYITKEEADKIIRDDKLIRKLMR
jgi:hypothetical protein